MLSRCAIFIRSEVSVTEDSDSNQNAEARSPWPQEEEDDERQAASSAIYVKGIYLRAAYIHISMTLKLPREGR